MTAIDLFAGLGGFTEGARRAGLRVVWAANHWQAAVDCHSVNHPETIHACQDLHQADWSLVPKHDVMLASPCCQGFTKARGKNRPSHDTSRATAWAVISCAEFHRPKRIVVENVPEFLNWIFFAPWIDCLARLGYKLYTYVFDAADFGVPQHRERAFVIATRSRSPLSIKSPRLPHVPARSIISRTDSWTPVRSLCANTRARVRNGRRQFGDSFLVAYYGNENGGRSLDKPLGTVTTRDRFGLVEGDHLRMLTVDEYRRAMGFPDSYKLPPNRRLATHLLGNAVCPPMIEGILRQL
jgi:DNA (cytosine-5)-methyltransferase 1